METVSVEKIKDADGKNTVYDSVVKRISGKIAEIGAVSFLSGGSTLNLLNLTLFFSFRFHGN